VRLTRADKALVYEDRYVRLRLSSDWRILDRTLKEPFEGSFSLRTVAEMLVLLRGVSESAPFIPV
jgi:hypothetical protein